ncbi:hypothetical protein B5F71_14780 [Bacteroides sp. An269]|nr:hypothetical protein B5F71_14780 [Bacteroides sp. An269]
MDDIIIEAVFLLWFPSQERTVLVRKPYGFGTENVKGRRLETDSKPFNHTLVHTLPNKLIRELQNSYTARFISAIRLINFHSKIR